MAMVKVDVLVDLSTGVYDVKFSNEDGSGREVDTMKAAAVVKRVMENIINKQATITTNKQPEQTLPLDTKKLN